MPKLINRPPKYSLHKPSGQAKVRYNGKTLYLGKHGTRASLEAYAEFVAKLPKSDGPPTFSDPPVGTVLLVGECVLRYQEHARTYYAREGVPTGEHVTIRNALRPLTKRFAELPVTEFGPKKLKKLREDMIALDWCRATVNRATNIVKRCLKWCASEELIPEHIANALKTVDGLKKNRSAAREKPPIEAVADDVVDATIPHVSDLVADIIRVMCLTGMRPGEAITMKPSEIDQSDPTCWVYRPGHHKTAHKGKARSVFVGRRAQEVISPYMIKAKVASLRLTIQGGSERGLPHSIVESPVFPITRASLRRAVQRGCDRAFPHPTISEMPETELAEMDETRQRQLAAELKKWQRAHQWHPNQLRHTAATDFRSRFGLEAAQVLLGHSKADTTQVYAERDLKKAADVARKIG
jgi:integrase